MKLISIPVCVLRIMLISSVDILGSYGYRMCGITPKSASFLKAKTVLRMRYQQFV